MIEIVKEKEDPKPQGECLVDLVMVEPGKAEKYGPSLSYVFRVLELDFLGKQVNGLTTKIWKPGNKLDKWLTAFGVDASTAVGAKLRMEQLYGQPVRALIELNKNGYPTVTQLFPLRSSDASRIAAAREALRMGVPSITGIHATVPMSVVAVEASQITPTSTVPAPVSSPINPAITPVVAPTATPEVKFSPKSSVPF